MFGNNAHWNIPLVLCVCCGKYRSIYHMNVSAYVALFSHLLNVDTRFQRVEVFASISSKPTGPQPYPCSK